MENQSIDEKRLYIPKIKQQIDKMTNCQFYKNIYGVLYTVEIKLIEKK